MLHADTSIITHSAERAVAPSPTSRTIPHVAVKRTLLSAGSLSILESRAPTVLENASIIKARD
jgi:hypothetical protein